MVTLTTTDSTSGEERLRMLRNEKGEELEVRKTGSIQISLEKKRSLRYDVDFLIKLPHTNVHTHIHVWIDKQTLRIPIGIFLIFSFTRT